MLEWSNVADVAVIGLIHDGVLENLLHFFLLLVQPQRTVPPHKVVNVYHVPRPKPVLPHPLHQCLQLVPRLQERRRYHLVLHHHQVLVSVELLGHGDL